MIGTNKKSKGFTLIELLVVMTLFLLVIGVAVAIFISIVQHQRKVLAEQQLLNQISYVEEYMSKALRMAKRAEEEDDFSCVPSGYIYQLTAEPDNQTGFYTGIRFINQSDNDACWEFFWDNSAQNPALKELKISINRGQGVPLTSENLKIEFVRFGINGSNGCAGGGTCPDGAKGEDGVQPRVTILLGVKIRGSDEGSLKIIQTTVSQRNLNVQ